ncbi:MAG TPA: YCF48-related protein, partial [Candidatus Binatia bacterium]|nr:YCF48-related protein [Candidatus Binatia bacterium]
TADGGATFTRIDSGTDLALYKAFARGNRLWIVGQEGLILHSADGGKTWQKQNSGTKVYLFSVYFINDDHGFAVGDKTTLIETTDGGKTWKPLEVTRSTEGANSEFALAMQEPILYDIRFTNEQTGWIAGEFGHLLKSTDGGQTWTPHQDTLMTPESGITDPMDLPTFFGEFMISDQEGLAAGIDGKIARTKDGGATWRFEPMKLAFPLIDPLYQPYVTADGNAWVVGGAGEVLRLAPGQSEWTRAELGMPLFTWMRGIDFADAQHGWLVGGYGTVLRTTDGGKTWSPRLG